ncbi:polyamine aminopropyltransferase [Thalassococcus lentus]|uniref:Polyamine aminopropyltransferase n=1 Tax=Thalassococcus lentus TaxID=1210524 RepID=A0ABT4XVG8_9RHOB|nr:polyamine aminopropyltransferase [Thalassococcus lentus]MDA7425949.1 polyamine aminopropyltransferase [Thalassococcus lentus]
MTETDTAQQNGAGHARMREIWLLAATFIIAVAGLIYELIAATVSSYLLGDSVRQFSLVIGVFLSAMGLGAWASRFIQRAMPGFIWAQLALGVLGGFMAPVLFFTYAWTGDVALALYGMLIAVGVLSGMEIPLIARVLKEIGAPEFRFENVLSVDYVGALVASLAFPLLVIPHLGLMSASLFFGCLNLAVAGLSLWLFREQASRMQWGLWGAALAVSALALVQSERLVSIAEVQLFEDDVIFSEATPYQQITVTRFQGRVRLFLDHSIQFDSRDEHRYHEALVHPAMARAPRRNNILILGGGDGMAAREVLRYSDVETVTLVDLDPRVTALFRDHPELSLLNDRALSDPRVSITNMDAWRYIETAQDSYDVIILDLPDPKNLALSKLYSRSFYHLLVERLSSTGLLVTQSGSPLFARQAYWSIVNTLETTRNPVSPGAGLSVLPYHVYLPSFGDWGFSMASFSPLAERQLALPDGLRFLTPDVWQMAQVFDGDTSRVEAEINTIQTHALLEYYLEGWDTWFR